MQSWGTRSRFDYRDTWPYPTKSGVIGLLAAALGRDREEDISDLAGLRMGVRVDKRGALKVDYQTAQNVLTADEKHKDRMTQSWRYYLSDAAFLVGLEGERDLLQKLQEALANPRYFLYLGRKGYVPSPPPYLPDGLVEEGLEEALRLYPYLFPEEPKEDLLLALEVPSLRSTGVGFGEGRLVYDQPLNFALRRFGPRYVLEKRLPKGEVKVRVGEQTGA